MDKTGAALKAIEAQAARGRAYQWPERSCVSLVQAVCAALGVARPDYGDFTRLTEARAVVLALRRYGGMANGHQALLQLVGWSPIHDSAALEACDVVSMGGVVVLSDYSRHDPPCPEGVEWTGVVGPDGHVWGWGPTGLVTVASGIPCRVTRWR